MRCAARKSTGKKIIAGRKSCKARGTGLSHYIIPGESLKKAKAR